MAWDPAVLRRYTTTGHFRLLNQVRTELRGNPLNRPKDGETVGAANRSRSLTRAIENRAQAGMGRSRRAAAAVEVVLATPEQRREALQERGERHSALSSAAGRREPPFDLPPPWEPTQTQDPQTQDPSALDAAEAHEGAAGFRARLNAIEMR